MEEWNHAKKFEPKKGCGKTMSDDEGSFNCGVVHKKELKLCPECEPKNEGTFNNLKVQLVLDFTHKPKS